MIFIIFIIYYLSVFFFPWEGLRLLPSISSLYLFEIIYVVVISILFKVNLNLRWQGKTHVFFKQLFITALLAFLSIFLIHKMELETPFKYLDNYIVQLILLAPIIEELIYRHLLFGLMEKKKVSRQNIIFFNALLFSFSHVTAFFSLPKLFYPFIFVQVFYTFILGCILTMSRLKQKTIVVPIVLHFVFNLIFLLFLT